MTPDQAPQFEFQGNADRPAQIELTPKSPEKKTDSLESIGQKVKAEFQTPEQQNIITSEFSAAFTKNLDKFSESFRQTFCNAEGQIDLKKILGLFGLDKILGNQIDDLGKVKPIKSTVQSPDLPPLTRNFEFETATSGKLPARPSDAPSGSEFMQRVNFGNMNDKSNQYKMEQAILAEIERGNVPSFSRPENMKTLTMKKGGITVNYKAGLDYLAVGSDDDFVRVPMTPLLAQTLSAKYGWGLPTREMTRNIYSNADIKLTGQGYITAPPGTAEQREQQLKMQGNEYIIRHNTDINKQLGPQGLDRLLSGQALVAGEKKDVIVSAYAVSHPGSLDFDGLYQNGRPIQRNPAHKDTYRDYSHGFRPIGGNVVVAYPDGTTVSMKYYDALKDPQIATVLNGAEGAIDAYSAYNKPIKSIHPKKPTGSGNSTLPVA